MEQNSPTDRQRTVLDPIQGHAAGEHSPVHVPDHELLRCIGLGSYGQVWLARHTMGMYRAVKIVARASFKDQKPFERELSGIRRFEPLSRSHEGFMDVLHVGIDEAKGFFYYVMELGDDVVSGQGIDVANYSPKTLATELSARGRLPWQECLELGIALSHALSELHKHDLVHRDIKPSNIIFVNGVPKLADIGLVADINEARSYVGTMGFMPPEGPGTPQADIYALGKVLYEACTGKDRQEFPELPTLWDDAEDPDRFAELNEVIIQACNNDPRRRYKTAWDLHADLLVLANGKSVKRLRTLERRVSLAKRAVGIVTAAGLLLGAFAYQAYKERKIVNGAREREIGANVAYGNRAMDGGDLIGALPYFAEALRLDEDEARKEEHQLTFGSILAQCPKLVQMWSGPPGPREAVFSPDGLRVLVVPLGGRAQVFEAATGKPVSPEFGQPLLVRQGAFSPDGRLVVTASEDKTARVWGVADGIEKLLLPHPNKVFTACFSPDGRYILTACLDNLAHIWNADSGALERSLTGHTGAVLFAAYSRDGRRIVTTSRDNTARVWDAATGKPLLPPLPHATWVRSAAFSPDGKMLVTACSDHRASLWEADTGRRLLPDLECGDEVRSVEFSPDGRVILTGSLDHTVLLWSTRTHQPLTSNPILRQSDRVTHATFSPEGNQILTACNDGTVWIWDLAGGTVSAPALRRVFSGDGSCFLNLTNGAAQVCETVSRQPVSPGFAPRVPWRTASLNSDGRLVISFTSSATNGPGGVLEVWETHTGKHMGHAIALNFSPDQTFANRDGSRILALSRHGSQVWNTVSGQLIRAFPEQDHLTNAVLNGAGDRLATSAGQLVRILDVAENRPLAILDLGKALQSPATELFHVSHIEFSPDDRLLVACGTDPSFAHCYAQVYDALSGRAVSPPLFHQDGVLFATFSPDSRRLATASEDFTGLVWDLPNGEQLTPALRHDEKVSTVAFSANGRWVLTAGQDKTARAWSVTTGDPLTPPLRHLWSLRGASFLANDTRIIAFDAEGAGFVWRFPADSRPAADAIALARLLCGGMIVPSADVRRTPGESPVQAWQRLRARYAADFETPADGLFTWHDFQAAQSEREEDWFAANFHLERLVKARPEDASLAARLAKARSCLVTSPL